MQGLYEQPVGPAAAGPQDTEGHIAGKCNRICHCKYEENGTVKYEGVCSHVHGSILERVLIVYSLSYVVFFVASISYIGLCYPA